MAGNRADVIAFAKSAIARMNPGQFVEQYICAASRDMSKWVRANFNILSTAEIWDKVMLYYHVAAPLQYATMLTNYTTEPEQLRHLESIIAHGIYLYIPADSPNLNASLLGNVEKIISPTYGPVTYRSLSGEMVTTKDKVFVGIHQMIVLEKTDQHPMAVSSGLIQHHGLLAGPNKLSRQGHPSKVQAAKVFSETEVRLYAAVMGGEIMADLLTMANSPDAHKSVVHALLLSHTPSNLSPISGINPGTARPIIFISHVLSSFGLCIKNNPE